MIAREVPEWICLCRVYLHLGNEELSNDLEKDQGLKDTQVIQEAKGMCFFQERIDRICQLLMIHEMKLLFDFIS